MVSIDWAYKTVADALKASGAVLDLEVPPAAEWLTMLGARVHAGAVRGELSWGLAGQRDLWKEAGRRLDGDETSRLRDIHWA